MSDNNLSGRRQNERRQSCSLTSDWVKDENHGSLAFLAPPAGTSDSPANPGKNCRTGYDRRQGERRKLEQGHPPPGMLERRIYPDLRGVVFPLFY